VRTLPIERADRPTVEEFRARWERPGRPVVITSAMRDWPALRSWSFDRLQALHGDRAVQVRVTDEARKRRSGADMHGAFLRRTLPLGEVLSHARKLDGGARYYLQHCDIARELPQLASDVVQPVYCPRWFLSAPLLWIGGPGAVTPLHYDYDSVLMAGVVGEKRYRLVSRRDSEKISGALQRTLWRTAPLDLQGDVSIDRPDLRDLVIHEHVLRPGELLFIPYRWWHHMDAADAAISVSWWWEPSGLVRLRDSMLSRALQPLRALLRAAAH
jgi:hypothetical protein